MQPTRFPIYECFADILQYPNSSLAARVDVCHERLTSVQPKAAALLSRFGDFVRRTPLPRMEEIYTHTFDLQVVCYPYAGYQLFGESYKRGAFLVKLKERYREFGFSVEGELPDHLSVILRFLSALDDEEEHRILVQECLTPALGKMIDGFDDSENVYRDVLCALSLILQEEA